MDESKTIVYNASTGETYTDTIVNAVEITEAVDTIVDSSEELTKANAKIAELESLILALNDESIALKTKIDSLNTDIQLNEEMKVLIAEIKSIDPKFDTPFLTVLTLDQLKLIKETFTRLIK